MSERQIVGNCTGTGFPVAKWRRVTRLLGLPLQDAEAVYAALAQAGSSGLAWREGPPADWTGERLLAAQEVLYHDRRMVFTDGRHYLRACAPPILDFAPDIPADKFVPAGWCIEYPRSLVAADSGTHCVLSSFYLKTA